MSVLESAGTMALPEGGRVDFNRLRRERRQRLLEAMAATGVDVLMLGRPANIAFASGARQLWTSGTRPFSPACVVVAATGRVHLLSTWDEGVPDEIPHRDLFGLSWNPAIASARLRAIEGLDAASRVATDGWGTGAAQLIASLCPRADVVDGGGLIRQARAAKSPDEMACLFTAAAAAEAGLSALSAALRPGVTERELVGVYAERLASIGMACPPTEGVVWVSTDSSRPRRVPSDRRLQAGDLVALNPGASFAGYEVTVGRTRVVGSPSQPGLSQGALATRAALDAVIGTCRPGATGADLLDAWERYGGTTLYEPLAWGLGLGVEAPVIGPGRLGRSAGIRAGAVLAVQAWTFTEGVGGILEQDVIAVGPEGPTVVTRSRSGFPKG
ncbi:MAG TPA: M24 family metallopeptidase [Acidimicrobiales bacterium]|nr:M24 family metallopeptidase [Acidimicrobiales bacterium]